MVGIYKIISPSNKIYVGQSIDIERRFISYKNLNGVRGQKALENSFFKYGVYNHIFEIIEECEFEELNNRERYWQDYYNVLKYGLNCKLSTSNTKSGILTQDIRDKISKSHIGIIPNDETKIKMSNSAKLRVRKPHTKEHSLNISKSKLGKKLSEKHRLSLCKKVIDTDTNIVYNSVQEAANAFNINKSTLTQYLCGFRTNKTTLKYV
jgi:group I intron endonuclease